MKKAIPFTIIFLIIILVYQFIVVFFEDGHEVSYEVLTQDKTFKVDERYRKKGNDDGYYLDISTDKDKEYIYYIENNYNKQKRILKDIEYYEKNDFLCIYPKTDENIEIEIQCSDGKEIYSYDYVNKKIDISEFIKELKLVSKYEDSNKNSISQDNVLFYNNNFYKDEYLGIYRYSYVSIFNDKTANTYGFSNIDVMNNELGTFIDHYFIAPVVENNRRTSYMRIIDMKKYGMEDVRLDYPLSNKVYKLGVIDKKLYLFDAENKIEFYVGIDGTYETIGTVEKGFKKYQDGEWIDSTITDFNNNEVHFSDAKKIDVELKYSYENIYETDRYFYIIENSKIYKIYKHNLDKRVLLFELGTANENIQIIDDRIYFINNDYLYRYDKYGIKTLVYNNEFKYNNQNIYHMYIEGKNN